MYIYIHIYNYAIYIYIAVPHIHIYIYILYIFLTIFTAASEARCGIIFHPSLTCDSEDAAGIFKRHVCP